MLTAETQNCYSERNLLLVPVKHTEKMSKSKLYLGFIGKICVSVTVLINLLQGL